MREEAPQFIFLTNRQKEERYRKAEFLSNPLSFEGGLIKTLIIDGNRAIIEKNPRITELIGLYTRLKEFDLTGASPTGQLASEWISLVGYSCELVLKEGEHQSAESFRFSREMFEEIYGKIRGLAEQKPRRIFKSLAFLIEEALKKRGVGLSTQAIEKRIKEQYEEHKEIQDSVKLNTLLPWINAEKL